MASLTPELEPGQTAPLVASTPIPTPGTELGPPEAATKQQRVLACVSCQQRKIKCDRRFPCAHCLRGGISCVPASLVPRQRRRRFPERHLLQRLRHYEDFLRQNNVDFHPLHPASPASVSAISAEQTPPAAAASATTVGDRDDGAPEFPDDIRSEISSVVDKPPIKPDSKPVDLWHAISRATLDSGGNDADADHDDGGADASPDSDGHSNGGSDLQRASNGSVHASAKKNAWDHDDTYSGDHGDDNDHLLFGATRTDVRLSSLHPEQVQIFRLWQVYLENVDPLLKVTHTPTLQPRIIDAISDLEAISPTLEALIFSIYCVAIMSLTNQECRASFGSPRRNILAGYQLACQQSLLNCKALRSDNLESLTALFLYLVSVRSQTDPRSLSSTLAIAMRVALRMGLHDESTYGGYSALEAEMRRRLWWSLVTFDHRLCEMSDYKTTNLTPAWDCKTPLSVNDFELRPEMKSPPPPAHDKPTEALFAVVRSELADAARHSAFHINFINPSLNAIARPKRAPAADGAELTLLEKTVEDRYLGSCDPGNPLHFMTIWTTRAYLARNRLLEHYSRSSASPAQQTEAQRGAAVSHALRMLECETRLRTSPLTRGFLWHVDCNVPALAYVHLLNGLGRRPGGEHAARAWEALSDNYAARASHSRAGEYGIPGVFSRVVLQVWAAREELCRVQGTPAGPPPRIVGMVRGAAAGGAGPAGPPQQQQQQQQQVDPPPGLPGASPPAVPVSFGAGQGPGDHQFLPAPGLGAYPEIPGQAVLDVDLGQFLDPVDWRWMHARGW